MSKDLNRIYATAWLHAIGSFAQAAKIIESGKIEKENLGKTPLWTDFWRHRPPFLRGANEEDEPWSPFLLHCKQPASNLEFVLSVAIAMSTGKREIPDGTQHSPALSPIFEQIALSDKATISSSNNTYSYPIEALSEESIFPVEQIQADENAYKILWDNFVAEWQSLCTEDLQEHLWIDQLQELMLKYTHAIPAPVLDAGQKTDVSLYDYSRTCAALAGALFLYSEADNCSIDKLKSYSDTPFLFVQGSFHGIQNFIFASGGQMQKKAAKLLRGRSFQVSLLSELAAQLYCDHAGLGRSSILLSQAGKFTILAPNLPTMQSALQKTQNEIEDWLYKHFYGEVKLSLVAKEAAQEAFLSEESQPHSFQNFWDSLMEQAEEAKYTSALSLADKGGSIPDYLSSFDAARKRHLASVAEQTDQKTQWQLCPYCNRRASSPELDFSSCRICKDQMEIGQKLVSQNTNLLVVSRDGKAAHKGLSLPVYERYHVSFTGKPGILDEETVFLWKLHPKARIGKSRYIGGYIPVFNDASKKDERFLLKPKLIEEVELRSPMTFHHMELLVLKQGEHQGQRAWLGTPALGILKADVDYLGAIFGGGLRSYSLSRTANLSRQLDYFFSLYLPDLLKKEFKNIYTVFAGGDDLFLIGPFMEILDFAKRLHKEFVRYTCQSEKNEVTLSCGIAMADSHTPIRQLAHLAEEALSASKNHGRNRITVFGTTATWEEYAELEEIRKQMEVWLSPEKKYISHGLFYRLHSVIEDAKKARLLSGQTTISMKDMDAFLWKARLRYALVRNIGQNSDANKEEALQNTEELPVWMERYKEKMQIPVWRILYTTRKYANTNKQT